jgi:pyroglutamyl-peptidase
MSILIAGFEPFGSETQNPALLAVNSLPDTIGDHAIHKAQLPVVYHESWQVLHKEIDRIQPKYVIVVGQAGGRPCITIERDAINVDDTDTLADNNGNLPKDAIIVEGGPHGYFTNLPFRSMIASIQKGGLPAAVSNDAGTFVCNHIFYQLMHYINEGDREMYGGFIHVPFITEQVISKPSQPSQPLSHIVKGLELAIGGL